MRRQCTAESFVHDLRFLPDVLLRLGSTLRPRLISSWARRSPVSASASIMRNNLRRTVATELDRLLASTAMANLLVPAYGRAPPYCCDAIYMIRPKFAPFSAAWVPCRHRIS